jgi:HPt (histidine-containing phosphotransfer) domain-containing protein
VSVCETGEGREERAEREIALGCEAQVFDEEDLLRNLGGDRDLVRCIGTLFLDDTRAGMGRLKELLDGSDAVEAGRLAHKMKGSAANMRAGALSGVFADIEQNASRGDLTRAAPLIEAAQREFERFRTLFGEKADAAAGH